MVDWLLCICCLVGCGEWCIVLAEDRERMCHWLLAKAVLCLQVAITDVPALAAAMQMLNQLQLMAASVAD